MMLTIEANFQTLGAMGHLQNKGKIIGVTPIGGANEKPLTLKSIESFLERKPNREFRENMVTSMSMVLNFLYKA